MLNAWAIRRHVVADTLQQLWISYNFIESLAKIRILKRLRVLYMSNNKIDKWSEFDNLMDLPELEDLLLVRNPLWDRETNNGTADGIVNWRLQVIRKLPNLKKLDGELITDDEREQAAAIE